MRCLVLLVLLAVTTASFAADPIPLWPSGTPGGKGLEADMTKPSDGLVAGKPVIRLGNVDNPTITVFSPPAGKNTGVAVVVCPGGGYQILAYDLEGTEVCDWLNSIGVTGVLLKYRVPPIALRKVYSGPLQDAQRALRLVRSHAGEWKIDPNRIGILGFSAGGHLSAVTACQFDKRTYEPVDAADSLSCRPDFAVLIYPAYLTQKDRREIVSPELTVTSNTPPTFLVQTEDDPVHVENSLYYFLALKKAHVPAELHVFPKGGHGYGLRASTNSVTTWPKLAEQWMHSQGILRGVEGFEGTRVTR
ncbi:MAG TPA: alpha/beta hydrolase [Verrucomicrobiae bacterium]|jgi:acetyl esterase/lipase|nr:alpha/beta hydrolase [Verrucomicrobiae bacterium]